jgi:hypothetical protein
VISPTRQSSLTMTALLSQWSPHRRARA